MRAYRHPAAGLTAVVAGLMCMGVDACVQTDSQRRADLRQRAEEILPDTATILTVGYGDCVELASSPSCAAVVFKMDESDSAQRAALLREAARSQGWTITHSDDAQGGWSVFVERDGYNGMAIFWRPEVYEVDCTGNPDPAVDDNRFCFNTLNLSR